MAYEADDTPASYEADDTPASYAKLQIPIPPPYTIHVHLCVLSFLKIYLKN
jgi:hypothetical protein